MDVSDTMDDHKEANWKAEVDDGVVIVVPDVPVSPLVYGVTDQPPKHLLILFALQVCQSLPWSRGAGYIK